MSIIKNGNAKEYTIMKNTHFRDKNLSLKAKGLLSMMFSLPDNWNFSTIGLTSMSSDGATSVRSALKELEEHKYLIRKQIRDNKGTIKDWEYQIFEVPYDKKPHDINQDVENIHVVNRTQYNTKEYITKELNNKEYNKEIYKESSIILKDESFYNITEEELNVYSHLYPNVDLDQEIRNMQGWCLSNPSKRKTKSGIKRFINGWLSKAQKDYQQHHKEVVQVEEEFPEL